jgi:hypothetical protein
VADRWTFKQRRARCATCGLRPVFGWTHEPLPPCPTCDGLLEPAEWAEPARAATVRGDEIDVVIEHGLCHADGTPRRFRSRQELRAAEQAAGLRVLEPGERFPGDARPRRRYLS